MFNEFYTFTLFEFQTLSDDETDDASMTKTIFNDILTALPFELLIGEQLSIKDDQYAEILDEWIRQE